MLKGDKKYKTGDSILDTQKLYGLMKGEKDKTPFPEITHLDYRLNFLPL